MLAYDACDKILVLVFCMCVECWLLFSGDNLRTTRVNRVKFGTNTDREHE